MSEKAKWTPSPRTVRYVAGMDGYQVWGAKNWVGDFSSKEEAELSAAAPAMAEALEELLKFLPIGFASTGRPGATDAKNAALDKARDKARAALALAHGESK